MACCGDNYPAESLENLKFDDINFKLEDENIVFKVDENDGGIYEVNKTIPKDDRNEKEKLDKKKKQLLKQIELKDDRIRDLKKKIEDIEQKIVAMQQILSIDVSEKEYVKALGEKLKNNMP